jgi:metallo-beta-lactamase class B
MRKYKYMMVTIFSFLFTFSISSCTNITTERNLKGKEKIKEAILKIGTDDSDFVQLTRINDNVWVHTTYYNFNGTRTLSNGLLVLTNNGLVLLDTPWTDEQTKQLINLVKEKFKHNIIAAIVTHAHMDRIGGIKTLLANKIDVKATPLTSQLAEKLGYAKPNPSITNNNTLLTFGESEMEVYFPGEGHTIDNIVVWLSDYNILYAGCIAKPMEANSMGNTDDANMKEWPKSIQNLIDKFPNAEIVIPSHGNWGDIQILIHTLELLKK